ncbi:lasso RiPP family leader peptide-containing protein [Goodfellowiella coeruleoviolacea]|uniref:Lasso RiPP family leader peptide-containing protein n=1 Tax=Goodfellowiella coeruleoviolacea TaxID=334858 RepID=A0AAE3GJF1_9PSEU|nr:lasso RiPP family leader peptide-containing protein [Goodfellowiella coeruleoviolacea]MCP2168399.1 hypothetical protein [Goodfellowiella coeruleoviolacea]
MDEQTLPEVYEPPALLAVGEFTEDTLGGIGFFYDNSFFTFSGGS